MARPAPDPERVMAVFELKFFQHKTHAQIVKWSQDEWPETNGISAGTVTEWVRTGHLWWAAEERLSVEQEYGVHRTAIGLVLERLVADQLKDENARELDLKEWSAEMARWVDLHGKATGIYARQIAASLGNEAPTISPEQRRATERLRARVQGNRGVIEG